VYSWLSRARVLIEVLAMTKSGWVATGETRTRCAHIIEAVHAGPHTRLMWVECVNCEHYEMRGDVRCTRRAICRPSGYIMHVCVAMH